MKLKKSNPKFKKKLSKKNIIQKIFEYNFTIKKKGFQKTFEVFYLHDQYECIIKREKNAFEYYYIKRIRFSTIQ